MIFFFEYFKSSTVKGINENILRRTTALFFFYIYITSYKCRILECNFHIKAFNQKDYYGGKNKASVITWVLKLQRNKEIKAFGTLYCLTIANYIKTKLIRYISPVKSSKLRSVFFYFLDAEVSLLTTSFLTSLHRRNWERRSGGRPPPFDKLLISTLLKRGEAPPFCVLMEKTCMKFNWKSKISSI